MQNSDRIADRVAPVSGASWPVSLVIRQAAFWKAFALSRVALALAATHARRISPSTSQTTRSPSTWAATTPGSVPRTSTQHVRSIKVHLPRGTARFPGKREGRDKRLRAAGRRAG